MTVLSCINDTAFADGHPPECENPVEGSVVSVESLSITVINSSSESEEVATVESADVHLDNHAHTYDGSCTDTSSHDIDPDVVSSSLSVDGSPVYLVGEAVGTDPESSGDIEIVSNTNNSLEVNQ